MGMNSHYLNDLGSIPSFSVRLPLRIQPGLYLVAALWDPEYRAQSTPGMEEPESIVDTPHFFQKPGKGGMTLWISLHFSQQNDRDIRWN
jgi:hypothetical protein